MFMLQKLVEYDIHIYDMYSPAQLFQRIPKWKDFFKIIIISIEEKLKVVILLYCIYFIKLVWILFGIKIHKTYLSSLNLKLHSPVYIGLQPTREQLRSNHKLGWGFESWTKSCTVQSLNHCAFTPIKF